MQAKTAQDKAGDYTQAAKDKAGDLTGSAKETAGQTQGKTGDYAQAAKEKTSSAADTLGSKVRCMSWSGRAAHLGIIYRVVIAVFICKLCALQLCETTTGRVYFTSSLNIRFMLCECFERVFAVCWWAGTSTS